MLRNRLVQIGLGIAFIVLIIWWRAGRAPSPPPRKEGAIILVAKRDIQPGELLTRENVIQAKVSKAPPGALSDWRDIEGAYALTFIRKGDPILKAQVSPREEVPESLSEVLGGGRRAMVFETTEAEMPIVKNIQKGDTIDILAVYQPPEGSEGEPYSCTVAQGVEVLDIVRVMEMVKEEKKEGEKKKAVPRVTKIRLILAVTPDQAERIALARQVAQVQFLLRPRLLPPPTQELPREGWRTGDLFAGAFPRTKEAKAEKAEEPQKPEKPSPVTPPPPSPPSMGKEQPFEVSIDMEKLRRIVREETVKQNKKLLEAIRRLEKELRERPSPPPEEVRKHKVEVIMGTERTEIEVEG